MSDATVVIRSTLAWHAVDICEGHFQECAVLWNSGVRSEKVDCFWPWNGYKGLSYPDESRVKLFTGLRLSRLINNFRVLEATMRNR